MKLINNISGTFEIHITVDPSSRNQAQQFCEEKGYKFLDIELDRGENIFQPMITYVIRKGDLEEVSKDAHYTIMDYGINPVRLKIESVPWNDGVPETDEDVRTEVPGRYWEYHIKLRLKDDQIEEVTKIAQQHNARLSRNAVRKNTNRSQERFITQRHYKSTRRKSDKMTARLMHDLWLHGYLTISEVQEYVVYDSNFDLDKGWIE